MNWIYGEFYSLIKSKIFRLVVLAVLFIALVLFRQWVRSFGVSIGYLYVLLISLAGFWFGVRGGIVAAMLSCGIFICEINIFRNWDARDLVANGIILRFTVYFLSGIVLGYLASVDKRLRIKLEGLVSRDELTNCLNYRWTMKRLEEELDRSRRYEKCFAIAMIDIDFFKKINICTVICQGIVFFRFFRIL